MAVLTIDDENRTVTDPAEIREYLQPHGIWYEQWPLEDRVSADASSDEILAAYAAEIDSLKQRGGYTTADVISVQADTPGLDQMLQKFQREHTHSEDEVRFTVKGRGVFHIHPQQGPVFGIQVGPGDLISVPQGTRHWFDLCEDRTIRCIRLFQDTAGWTPHYIEGSALHQKYLAVCLGPQFIEAHR
jgi:1,2-dihydroxy-3-keto-5-methylthiopentene dioxygenase